MPRYRAMVSFVAKQLNEPDTRVVTAGEELVLLRWMGDEHERSAIFAISMSGASIHGPAYEATRDLFETSTEAIGD